MTTGSEIVAAAQDVAKQSKFKPVVVDTLLTCLSDGLTIEQSCRASGITRETLSQWRERYPELAEQLEQARERARQKALAVIRAAGETDWRAMEAFLRLSFQADYNNRNNNINVSATANVIVCNEETRQRLILLNQKLLSGSSETKTATTLTDNPQAALPERQRPDSLPAIEVKETQSVLVDTPNMENT